MAKARSAENSDLPEGFYRKKDKRAASGFAYQMNNPFYGIEGEYKPTIKRLSLKSDFDTAIGLYQQVLAMYSKWAKSPEGKAHFHQKSTNPGHIKTPYAVQVKCANNVLVKNLAQRLLDDNKSRVKLPKPQGIR